jgi:hypothetical protein
MAQGIAVMPQCCDDRTGIPNVFCLNIAQLSVRAIVDITGGGLSSNAVIGTLITYDRYIDQY